MLRDLFKAFCTLGNTNKMSKLIDKLSKADDPDHILIAQLRNLMTKKLLENHPIGARCRIYTEVGTNAEPSHIIIGHITDNSDGVPLVQVHPLNPRHRNDSYSNLSLEQVEVVTSYTEDC